MGQGSFRNAPCWCGSGRKFKACHWNRGNEAPIPRSEAKARFERVFSRRMCLHPEAPVTCKGPIVRAHSVQRAGNLKAIARVGHVYAFPLRRVVVEGSGLEPELTGQSVASTFSGFCELHDRTVFEPIDRRPFDDDPVQAFLLAYRALCRELYTRMAAIEAAAYLRDADRGRSNDGQVALQLISSLYRHGLQKGGADLSKQKSEFDEILMRGDYSSRIAFLSIHFDRLPSVLASGGHLPEFTFDGTRLQDLAATDTLDAVFHSTVATKDAGASVFTWLNRQESPSKFARSLAAVPLSRSADAILRFQFEFCENVFIAPAWWEDLGLSLRTRLVQRYWDGSDPSVDRLSTCLTEDGVRFADWVAVSRFEG
ncbi:MAG: SEC-C domain-containing protein [Dehalococcoidia bacterium]